MLITQTHKWFKELTHSIWMGAMGFIYVHKLTNLTHISQETEATSIHTLLIIKRLSDGNPIKINK